MNFSLFSHDIFPNRENFSFFRKTFPKRLGKNLFHLKIFLYMLRTNGEKLSIGGLRLIWKWYHIVYRALYGSK